MKVIKLVLIRHGESKWNKLNKFTGWYDVGLSKTGKIEAYNSGKLLKKYGFTFDLSYTSVLKRAIHTLWYILKELDISWIPTKKDWHLNERHYGALQGLNKEDTATKYGNEIVQSWRRSFNAIPPKLDISDKRYPGYDIRYLNLKKDELPVSESLKLTLNRVISYWKEQIFPNLKNEKKIIIVAHGNSLRALLKYLSNIDDTSIVDINIPTGIPIIYEFNQFFTPIKYYLLNQ